MKKMIIIGSIVVAFLPYLYSIEKDDVNNFNVEISNPQYYSFSFNYYILHATILYLNCMFCAGTGQMQSHHICYLSTSQWQGMALHRGTEWSTRERRNR